MCCITAYAAETGDQESELSYAIQRLKEYNPAIKLLSNNQVNAIEAVTALNEAIKSASSPSKWTFIVPLVCGCTGGFLLNCLHQCCVNKMIQSTRKKIESTKSKVVTFIQSRHTSLEDIPHQDEKAQSSKIDTQQQQQSSSCGMSCPSFFTLCKCQKKSDESPSSKQVDTEPEPEPEPEPERQWYYFDIYYYFKLSKWAKKAVAETESTPKKETRISKIRTFFRGHPNKEDIEQQETLPLQKTTATPQQTATTQSRSWKFW
ncbi:hypothetical protein [Endozoicomonas sp. Mp262]|uniref:hypothetical protein n=1 Tax=Endozoicomonas sp. Mp262 TaxID=2919499 RepID=UPI0021D848DA